MRRVATLAGLTLVAACAQAPRVMTAECVSGCAPVARPAADADAAPSAFVVQQMPASLFASVDLAADSTTAASAQLIASVDAAVLQALTAFQVASLEGTRPAVRESRVAMQNAGTSAAEVIKQGDKLNQLVTALPTAANRPWKTGADYARYWSKARHQLVLARNSAGQAVDAANAALACNTMACARPQLGALKQASESSAGATYQAEPLLRIAMVYATSKYGTGL